MLALTVVLIALSYWRTPQRIPPPRLRDQRRPDGVRLPAGRLSAVGILPGSVMATNELDAGGPVVARERIMRSRSGAALLVAGVILVIAVLPAEYGVDPTGIGRQARADGDERHPEAPRRVRSRPRRRRRRRRRPSSPRSGPISTRRSTSSSSRASSVEYKYRLDKGEALLYSWKATGAGELRVSRRARRRAAGLRRDLREEGCADRRRRAR